MKNQFKLEGEERSLPILKKELWQVKILGAMYSRYFLLLILMLPYIIVFLFFGWNNYYSRIVFVQFLIYPIFEHVFLNYVFPVWKQEQVEIAHKIIELHKEINELESKI